MKLRIILNEAFQKTISYFIHNGKIIDAHGGHIPFLRKKLNITSNNYWTCLSAGLKLGYIRIFINCKNEAFIQFDENYAKNSDISLMINELIKGKIKDINLEIANVNHPDDDKSKWFNYNEDNIDKFFKNFKRYI